jgi:hypothetical protein
MIRSIDSRTWGARSLEQVEEWFPGQGEEQARRLGRHRRQPVRLAQQRDLADVVAVLVDVDLDAARADSPAVSNVLGESGEADTASARPAPIPPVTGGGDARRAA